MKVRNILSWIDDDMKSNFLLNQSEYGEFLNTEVQIDVDIRHPMNTIVDIEHIGGNLVYTIHLRMMSHKYDKCIKTGDFGIIDQIKLLYGIGKIYIYLLTNFYDHIYDASVKWKCDSALTDQMLDLAMIYKVISLFFSDKAKTRVPQFHRCLIPEVIGETNGPEELIDKIVKSIFSIKD